MHKTSHSVHVLAEEMTPLDRSSVTLEEVENAIKLSSASFMDIHQLVLNNPEFFELSQDPSRTWVDCLRDRLQFMVEAQRRMAEFQSAHKASLFRFRRELPKAA